MDSGYHQNFTVISLTFTTGYEGVLLRLNRVAVMQGELMNRRSIVIGVNMKYLASLAAAGLVCSSVIAQTAVFYRYDFDG